MFTYDVRTAFTETFAPESAAGFFTEDYWKTVGQSYLNFRLDQAPDFVHGDPDAALDEDSRVALRQLSERVFALSDVSFGGVGLVFFLRDFKKKHPRLDQIYGWETPRPKPPPCPAPPTTTGIPLTDHIASRAYTTRLRVTESPTATSTATLTQLLLEDADGRLGWLLSLRGAVAFEEKAGSDARPVKITVKVEAKDGLDAVLHFTGEDKFLFTGAPSGAMSVAIEPAQPATAGPAFALPDSTGHAARDRRLLLQDRDREGGFKLAAATKKSAFVIAAGDADPFVKESLRRRRRASSSTSA